MFKIYGFRRGMQIERSDYSGGSHDFVKDSMILLERIGFKVVLKWNPLYLLVKLL